VGQAARTRVLLVDDDEAFLESAAEILAADERLAIVGAARDGAEAITLAELSTPDLVLMDIAMPAIDGVEATRAIHATMPQMPVVMLTGRKGRDDTEAAAEAGAIGYIQKEQLGSPHFADSLLALLELS
jgi:DNA-binding NarL/FixJ family response regulator